MVCAIEFSALARVNGIRLTVCGNFAFAANCRDASAIAIFIYVNAECARLSHVKRKIRCVDFIDIAFAQLTNPEIDGALG